MSVEIVILCLTGIGWLIGQWILKNRELEYKHFERKAEVYQKYLNSFIEMAIDIRPGKPINLQQSYQPLLEFKEAILIWGKPRMIKDFVKYQELLQNMDISDKSPVITIEFLEKMIRRDLGHFDFMLKTGELAQIFIDADVKSILKRKNKK